MEADLLAQLALIGAIVGSILAFAVGSKPKYKAKVKRFEGVSVEIEENK